MAPSSDDIRGQLLAIFREEQAEHLQAIRAILATAAFGDAGEENQRPLLPEERDEVYRRIHSLKGAARAVERDVIEQLAHRAEAILGRLRSGELSIPTALLYSRLQEVLDAFDALALLEGGSEPVLQEATQRAVRNANAAMDILEGGQDSAPLAVPSPPPVAPEETMAPARHDSGEDVVRVPIRRLDTLLTGMRQFQMEMERQQRLIDEELRELATRLRAENASGGMLTEAHTLRRRSREYTWRLRRLADQLQEEVQAARLVSVESATEGLDRMLRGIARQNGKDASLTIVGSDIRVDREVAQALRDPLTHLLRNTISHGIETPGERTRQGKPPAGQVTLRFRVRGTRLEVEVQDDGRGIDITAIRRASAASASVSAEEIAQQIFQPGFSTIRSGAVDRLAGRGMGLSIVAQSVARLGGEVRALPGEGDVGTVFRLLLPLSAATHRLLLVELHGQLFGVPTFVVETLHRVDAARIEPVENTLLVRLPESAPVPLADMGALLGLPPVLPTHRADTGRPISLVVARLGGERYALAVHRFREEASLLTRPLGPYLPNVPLFGGSVVLADGTIGLTLRPAELARRIRGGTPLAFTAMAAQSATARRTPTILVADDSVTTRTLEKSILEAQGYRVRLAVDGEEALALLRESAALPDQAIDLVVSDLEMPRRNGFELLRAIKEDTRLAHLPVILVTSREAFEDREQGLALGADAYIVKRKFDQTTLLETIEQLLGTV